MPRSGTKRSDLPATCPECGMRVKPSNYERHLRAAHPDSPAVAEMEREKIRELLRR